MYMDKAWTTSEMLQAHVDSGQTYRLNVTTDRALGASGEMLGSLSFTITGFFSFYLFAFVSVAHAHVGSTAGRTLSCS
jgi:hypothetical protein